MSYCVQNCVLPSWRGGLWHLADEESIALGSMGSTYGCLPKLSNCQWVLTARVLFAGSFFSLVTTCTCSFEDEAGNDVKVGIERTAVGCKGRGLRWLLSTNLQSLRAAFAVFFHWEWGCSALSAFVAPCSPLPHLLCEATGLPAGAEGGNSPVCAYSVYDLYSDKNQMLSLPQVLSAERPE